MYKLIKYELKKSAPFRIIGVLLALILAIVANSIFSLSSWGVIAFPLYFSLLLGLFALLAVGSLYQLKSDLDKPAPLVYTSPYKGKQIARAKVWSVFMNIVIVLFFTIFFTFLLVNIRRSYWSYEYFMIGEISKNYDWSLKGMIYGLTSYYALFLNLINWISIVYLAMSLVRVKYRDIGLFKWGLMAFAFYFLTQFAVTQMNNLMPLVWDLEKMQVYFHASTAYDPFSYDPLIIYKLIQLKDPLAEGQRLALPLIYILPNILVIGLTVANVRISGYLIDKKIDF